MNLVNEHFPSKWSKIFVTAGPAGNRNDLVGGWLSSHCERFFPNDWTMSPVWGKSECRSWWNLVQLVNTKNPLDFQSINTQIKEEIKGSYSADGGFAVVKSHLASEWLRRYLIDQELQPYFVVIDIVPTTESANAKMSWENFVKGFLYLSTVNRRVPQVKQRCQAMLGDDYSNDIVTDLISVYENWKIVEDVKFTTSSEDAAFPFVRVDYDDLMQPDGMKRLEQRLGLIENPNLNVSWQQCVAVADVPDRVWAHGREWIRFDLQ